MSSKRDDYVDRLKMKLDGWNEDIDGLEARLADLVGSARRECEEQVAQLRARRQSFEDKLHTLNQAAGEAWQDMKAGMDDAADALGSAIKSALERFGKAAATGSK
jgi:chromosome segregation ATPase